MESFRIAQESVDERTQLIAVHGEMDRYQAPELEGMVDSAMSSGRRTVVVDICEATYMDSSAISRLIESSNRVRDGGGSFTLVCGRAPMRRSLEMKGL